MSLIEVSLLIIAVAVVALVAMLVPILLQAKRTLVEAELSLVRFNTDLLPLMSELRNTMGNVNELIEKSRDGVEHASVLLHAVGEIGETVEEVHQMVRGTGGALLRNMVNVVFAGIHAATAVFSGRAASPRNS